MPKKTVDLDVVRELTLALPGVEEGTLHGVPSWKLRRTLLACPAIHRSAEPDTLVVRIDRAERTKLLETKPDVYYITDHYLKHPMVLVRLARIDRKGLSDLLGMARRSIDAESKPTHRQQKS
jgi:hypothetical protein